MYGIEKGIEVKEDKNYIESEMLKTISSFKNLPIKHQLSALKSFIKKVKNECSLKKRISRK